ncbi:MAG: MBOAT family O-acyltransferase [Anaerolineales bacterium]|nr:MAG: MBOAT family O-acyltransferase [Anaerolineales bacterium]
MGLTQIFASILTILLVAILTRGTSRVLSLLALSVLAVFWFQPAIPLRSFDFWIPSLTILLVVAVWFITSQTGAWKSRQNLIGLAVIAGAIILVGLTRYIFPDPVITTTTPPRLILVIGFIIIAGISIVAFTFLSRRLAFTLTLAIILLLAILVILKSPFLSLQLSVFLRELTGRPIDTASALDFRWLGFSYISFRLIHVLRDKQTGRLPELSLPEFATYVVFFPSLSAGPIDRAERFASDLRKEFALTQDETLLAGQRIVIGLFKKFVIADALALMALNDTLATQVRYTGWMWIIVYAYTFQIYFDFSGYTDIAIGIARLVGIKLPENFTSPYTKPNLTQFWNSWHITLTQWIRSYFFNPFNRWIRGYKIPMWTMLLLGQLSTMLLIGLWHGVTVNFILWGAWHGLGLFIQNRWSDFAKKRIVISNPRLQTALNVGGVLLTFHFVALGWVFFALSEPTLSWHVIKMLFGVAIPSPFGRGLG